ncbi:MAG: hypothetical protein GF390_01435 [Candidatus Pacebacteria bacterium]|nr:hypothetical protein [Candidatus Paceibacterota bacterium]
MHGTKDEHVPLQSNDRLPSEIKMIKVIKGDRHLEKVNLVKQYLSQVIEFILTP